MQYIVVGAGIVGAAIADRLAEQGCDVTVLEQAVPASQASSKSFGWINANYAETPSYYLLRRAAIEHFRILCSEMDLSHAVRWMGSLWWEQEGEDLKEQFETMQTNGYPCEIINGETFSKLEPAIANPPSVSIRTGLEGAANAEAVVHSLLERAAENGAKIITGCRVENISRETPGSVVVRSNLGQFTTQKLVMAAGAQSEFLLAQVDVMLPLLNKVGIILQTAPISPLIDHVIMSPDIHFHQRPDGRLILGEIFSGSELSKDQDINDLAQSVLMRLRTRLPRADHVSLESVKAGLRPIPSDGLPVIGPAAEMPEIYIASMHSGVTLAPLVGQLVAEELLGVNHDDILEEFRHSRFS